MPFSGRAVLKVARTIANLEQEGRVMERHVAEALQYRPRVVSTGMQQRIA